MQVSDLITMLRSDLLDDATKEPLWDDNALIRAINEAQRQACSRGDYIFHKFPLAIKEGAETYRLDPHITRIVRILIDGVEIHRKTRHELDDRTQGWRTREGEETVAVINGRNIHITPKPTADAACIIEAYRMPCKVASPSDELQIIPEYQPDLRNYCLYYLLSKRDVDTVDGDGEVPDQYKVAAAAAKEAGMPALVVVAGDKALRVVKDPETQAEVMEAVP